jgi:DUF1009 family protein
MRETGTSALAVDAGRTLLLDRRELLERANQASISIVAQAIVAQATLAPGATSG